MNRVYSKKEDFINENQSLGTDLPYTDDISVLSEKVTIGNIEVPNRLACQAMSSLRTRSLRTVWTSH